MYRKLSGIFIVLFCLLACQAWALTPEKPLDDLEDGDVLTATWLVGTFDTIYDWAQGASGSLDLLTASMAAAVARTNAVAASVTQVMASVTQVISSAADSTAFNALSARSDGHVASSTGVHGLGDGVSVDGASNSAVLTNKTLSTGCVWNGSAIDNAYLTASSGVVPNNLVVRDGSGAIAGAGANAYDVAAFIPGTTPDASKVFLFVAPRTITFPTGLSGSYAHALAQATSQTKYDIWDGSTDVATITFAGSGTTGSFSGTLGTIHAGDVLKITGPAVGDATLADVGITLSGTY